MKRRVLVIDDVRDSKGNPTSYLMLSTVLLDDAVLKTVDVVVIDEQVASGIREVMRAQKVEGRKP